MALPGDRPGAEAASASRSIAASRAYERSLRQLDAVVSAPRV